MFKYEKRILGLREKKNIWNTYDNNIEVKSDDSDSGYSDEKEYMTDED